MKIKSIQNKEDKQNKQGKGVKRMKTLLITSLLFMQSALANVVYWGTGVDCDYEASEYSVQEVIDLELLNSNSSVQIRLTNQQVVNENLMVSHDGIDIQGGYADCNSYSTSEKTTIQGIGNGPVIRIVPTAGDLPNVVNLSNLLVRGGYAMGTDLGGGINLVAPQNKTVSLFINDSLITQNTSKRGGGVFVSGSNSILRLMDTLVINNEAYGQTPGDGLGGGIYCKGGLVYLDGDTGVSQNRATGSVNNTGHGGGIYASVGCTVYLNASTDNSVFDFRGVSFNAARGHGGGIYASNSDIWLSSYWSGRPSNVNNNSADSNDDGSGDGGGIYLSGTQATATLNCSTIKGNNASNGVGIAVKAGALLNADMNGGFCWDISRCNQIINNETFGDNGLGGGLLLDEGLANISYTHIAYNQAHEGVAIHASDNSSMVLKRMHVYRNGENNGSTWDSQHTLRMVDSFLQVYHITAAMNDTAGATFSLVNSDRVINNSIIYEPLTNQIGNFIGGSGTQDCNLLDNAFGWQNGSNSLVGDPGFVALADDDLHIAANSMAIDACDDGLPGRNGGELDVDGEATPVDEFTVVNGKGIYDIGADEYHNADIVFSNGFE